MLGLMLTRPRRALVAGALAMLVAAGWLTTSTARAQAPSAPQRPIFRAGVNTVRIDAVVTSREGAPVTSLTKDDFEVTEDGKRQTVTVFNLAMLDGGLMAGPDEAPASISSDEVEQEEARREDVRLFTIFLDDYHVSRESGRIVREQISRFVETQLGPSDMVGVMYPLTPLASVRMTRDHASIVRAVQQFEGRQGDYTPKNAIEEGYVYKLGMGQSVEEIRHDVVMSALRALAMRMGGLKDGRQTILYVSEGFSSADRSRLLLNLREVADVAARHNTAIYPVNPRILAPNEKEMPGNALDSLDFLAEHSGGRTLVDATKTGAEYRARYATVDLPRSQLALAMKQAVIDASVYYLIGYDSALKPDGKFHRVSVKVKRKGVEVRHREGYWARAR